MLYPLSVSLVLACKAVALARRLTEYRASPFQPQGPHWHQYRAQAYAPCCHVIKFCVIQYRRDDQAVPGWRECHNRLRAGVWRTSVARCDRSHAWSGLPPLPQRARSSRGEDPLPAPNAAQVFHQGPGDSPRQHGYAILPPLAVSHAGMSTSFTRNSAHSMMRSPAPYISHTDPRSRPSASTSSRLNTTGMRVGRRAGTRSASRSSGTRSTTS